MGVQMIHLLKGDDVEEEREQTTVAEGKGETESLSRTPAREPVIPVQPREKTDQQLEDERQAELQAERDVHNERTGGGAYPTSDQKA